MKIIMTVLLFCFVSLYTSAITADEIIDRLEDNLVFETSYSEGSLIIKNKYGTRTSRFNSWSKGEDLSLIEFTSIEEEGQKVLRTENEIYLYFPDAEELIRLQGAALRESLMGSDFSYEDMTGDSSLVKRYKSTLLSETDIVNGRACYKIEMKARSRKAAYPTEILWIDKKDFIYLKVEKYAKSGKLLKEMLVKKVEKIQGHSFPVITEMRDKLKNNSSTVFTMDKIELDIIIDENIFSLEELMW